MTGCLAYEHDAVWARHQRSWSASSAGDIASRFEMSKPWISQHLSVLEAGGLVESEKRGQSVFYRQVRETLMGALTGFAQEACPVGRPLKRESAAIARKRSET